MAKSPEAFRTIGEVSDWLDTPPHVLRFWESRFAEVKPVKRAGGRRYYRPADMDLLGGIKKLLHDDGVTIRGVQKILQEKGVRHVAALCAPMAPPDAAPPPADVARRAEEAPAPQPAANATDAPVAAQPDAPPDAAPPAIDRAALRPIIARLQALSERMARPPMAK